MLNCVSKCLVGFKKGFKNLNTLGPHCLLLFQAGNLKFFMILTLDEDEKGRRSLGVHLLSPVCISALTSVLF